MNFQDIFFDKFSYLSLRRPEHDHLSQKGNSPYFSDTVKRLFQRLGERKQSKGKRRLGS